MKIDVIDMKEPVLAAWAINRCTPTTNGIFKIYESSMGVWTMIQQLTLALNQNTIDVLRIWGHGHQGIQSVCGGKEAPTSGTEHSYLSDNSIGFYAEDIATLGSLLTYEGRLELKGCAVGGDQTGADFLRNLVSLLNHTVHAGLQVMNMGEIESFGPLCGWVGGIKEILGDGNDSGRVFGFDLSQ